MNATRDIAPVLVVGAGPAGQGVAAALRAAGVPDIAILDRHGIGASFRRWPADMRLITPSFPGHEFGVPDLNAITPDTCPSCDLGEEHPTGRAYADYLESVAERHRLTVESGVDVHGLAPAGPDLWKVRTSRGERLARRVVWAAGEFQYPRLPRIDGAEHGVHTSRIDPADAPDAGPVLVAGGAESGVDAACALAERGREVRVFDGTAAWLSRDNDPSRALSPRTRERLGRALRGGRLTLEARDITRIEAADGGYRATDSAGEVHATTARPLLATGFHTSATLIRPLLAWRPDGLPLVSARDESTRHPGLFLAGPMLRHGDAIFCFIYKYRRRFAVVADHIARRLGANPAGLAPWVQAGWWHEVPDAPLTSLNTLSLGDPR